MNKQFNNFPTDKYIANCQCKHITLCFVTNEMQTLKQKTKINYVFNKIPNHMKNVQTDDYKGMQNTNKKNYITS